MPQEISKKNKKGAIIFWALSVICMGVIFYFSSRTADESTIQSDFILHILQKIFGKGAVTEFITRKLAHFCEFAGLSLLLNSALIFTKGKRQMPLAIAITSAYAITDEVHQIFVDGRACQFRDWLIDTSGAITGAVAFLIMYIIIDKIINRRKNNEHISI